MKTRAIKMRTSQNYSDFVEKLLLTNDEGQNKAPDREFRIPDFDSYNTKHEHYKE